jgi:hypothetical protein
METADRNIKGQQHRNNHERNRRNDASSTTKAMEETEAEREKKDDANGQQPELEKQHCAYQSNLDSECDHSSEWNLFWLACHGALECV